MTYAEMIALPDNYGASELGNDESDGSTDEDATPTPRPSLIKRQPSSSASTVHNININYRHTYSVARTNGDEVDLPKLLQSLARHTSLESPSKAMATAIKTATEEPLKHKRMRLVFDNTDKPLYFTALDISDPPHLKYPEDLEGLVVDWDDSAHLIVKGVPIALKYWSKVFPRARKEAWEVLKNNWSNWRVLPLILIVRSRKSRASRCASTFAALPFV
jgi:hypothetical protein